ncbi:MAG: hypothetical protein UY63_C0007G0005 [Parcubacteria group bacterium GW2011_GWA2_51_10]|nr:MAG: hypothetical protein UY63_C0007G0005 [Parcubacteria group bacterium GW2011_GWA2_51_10]
MKKILLSIAILCLFISPSVSLAQSSCSPTPVNCLAGETLIYVPAGVSCPNAGFVCVPKSGSSAIAPKPVSSPGTSLSTKSDSLMLGAQGSLVIALQRQLIRLGFLEAGYDTGYFGSLTQGAVRAFQRERGIVNGGNERSTGYGLVGVKTSAALRAALNALANSVSEPPVATLNPNPISVPPIDLSGASNPSAFANSQVPVSVPEATLPWSASTLAATGGSIAPTAGDLASASFLQAGSGARARTFLDKGRDVVNVRDFGMVCDGSTAAGRISANTTALQAAVTYVTSLKAGAALTFPEGICVFGNGIDWPKTVPVNIKGQGPFTTFLYQRGAGNANGAIRVNGGKGNRISGSVYWSPKPTGSITDLAVMSDDGPAIKLLDASNIVVDRVWGVWANADHAILDIDGGTINLFSNSWYGESDLSYFSQLATVAAGHPTEKYSIRVEPRTHTVEGTTLRSISTEQQFVNVRVGYSATKGAMLFSNPDPSVYASFGHMLTNVKINCRAGVPALTVDNVELQGANVWIETADAAADCLRITGGSVDMANLNMGGVLRTIRGATAINLTVAGQRVGSLHIQNAPIDRLHFRGVELDVEPGSVSAQFAATLAGTKDVIWEGNSRGPKTSTIKDAYGAGLRIEADGTYYTQPALRLKQSAGSGVTAAEKQWSLSSTGNLQATDPLNANALAGVVVGGVNFGAGTSLANYEEGTCTAALTFGGGSTGLNSSTACHFTRIGRLVQVAVRVTLTAKGYSTGTALVTLTGGVPVVRGLFTPGLIYADQMASTVNAPLVLANQDSTTFNMYSAAAGVLTILNDTHFTSTSDIIVVHA